MTQKNLEVHMEPWGYVVFLTLCLTCLTLTYLAINVPQGLSERPVDLPILTGDLI